MDKNILNNNYKTFPVTFNVSDELISDLLISAVETAIHYWCTRVECDFDGNSNDEFESYADIKNENWAIRDYQKEQLIHLCFHQMGLEPP